jgi:hypothetical protein
MRLRAYASLKSVGFTRMYKVKLFNDVE